MSSVAQFCPAHYRQLFRSHFGFEERRALHFRGSYDSYCYLPLYIFAGDQLLCARLRPTNQDAAKGSVQEVSRIVAQLRQRWAEMHIVLRANSGFCREDLMPWCETNGVNYVFGLARNQRLRERIDAKIAQASALYRLACTLMEALRRLGLRGTEWAEAREDSIRPRIEGGAMPNTCAETEATALNFAIATKKISALLAIDRQKTPKLRK